MSCFWIGILSSLQLATTRPYIQNFIYFLKKHNRKTTSVLWNNNPLTEQVLNENYIHIQTLNLHDIDNGYLCSVCEPVLLLISELFQVHIQHTYIDTKILYTYIPNMSNMSKNPKTLYYQSDTGHFWYIKN